MNLESLTVVLPCHSLEDLSVDRDSAEAEQVLAAWSALYHPALMVKFRGPPAWRGAINAPTPPDGHLIVVPPCCEDDLPSGWLQTARKAEALVILGCERRDEILAKALEAVESPVPEESSADLVKDFLALGYCRLIVELLTRQLRYMSNLDEVAFEGSALSAAEKWAEGDTDAAREHLTSAFDLLTEAREYFYPVETYLLDLTLVARTTIGPELDEALAGEVPSNLVMSGVTLRAIADQRPDALATLREGLDAGRVSIVGGEYEEKELPLLGPEAMLAQFRRGREVFEQLLGRAPTIFGRRRFGLSPILPQVLEKCGFTGACHFTLDDGRFPVGNQSRIKWEGNSGATMDCLVRLPCDASRTATFLALSERLGNAMDLDHAATAVFAHWPAGQSIWYDDLVRGCRYSPVVGRFFSMDEYFRDTKYVGQSTRYAADAYRSPFLNQSIAAGEDAPLSRWQEAAESEIRDHAAGALRTMAALVSRTNEGASGEPTDCLQQIGEGLAGGTTGSGAGCLVVNPLPFTRKSHVDISAWDRLPAVGGSIVAAAEQDGGKTAIVTVPGMGFAWIDPDMAAPSPAAQAPKKSRRWFGSRKDAETPPMAEEATLRNDFFEVKVDPVTGCLRSLHDYQTRDNRMALQLAYRRAANRGSEMSEDPDMLYSVMAADEVSIRAAGPLCGELAVKGRLLERDGTCLAQYEQVLRAWRGSRILEIDIALDPVRLPENAPWTNYYAARFAWGDATADVFAGVSTTTLAAESPRMEAPYFVDVCSEKIRTTILTGGLTYHRRFGLRKLDTLLITAGESRRRFRLGLAIDPPYPFAAATEFLTPASVLSDIGPSPGPRTGWFFHLNARNVVTTSWEPVIEGQTLRGVRVRLAETENRAVDLRLRCHRQVAAARRTNFLGNQIEELGVSEDCVTAPLKGREWTQIEIDFGQP